MSPKKRGIGSPEWNTRVAAAAKDPRNSVDPFAKGIKSISTRTNSAMRKSSKFAEGDINPANVGIPQQINKKVKETMAQYATRRQREVNYARKK